MANFHVRKLEFSRFAQDGTKMHYYDIVVDTAEDIPDPAEHPEWEIGSELVVLENGGSKYQLSNAREWVAVNFNSGGGGDSAKLQEELEKAKAMVDGMIDKSVMEVYSNVSAIREYAFISCDNLVKAVFPMATKIHPHAFKGCTSLKILDITNVDDQSEAGFDTCTALEAVIFRRETICGLVGLFKAQVPTARMYVPKSIVESYRSAFQSTEMFRPLEDYTVDGTITGELDETKI